MEEIVCEENGILISAILRQYLMGLRTVGQWKKLARCWSDVADKCACPMAARKAGRLCAGSSSSACTRTMAHTPCRPRTWKQFLPMRKGLDSDPGTESDDDDDILEQGDEGIMMMKTRTKMKMKKKKKKGVEDKGDDDEDDDDEDHKMKDENKIDDAAEIEENLERMDWELLLIRKFFGRWADKAGVRREVCDPDRSEAERIDWTRVVAPVVEGRIKMVPVREG